MLIAYSFLLGFLFTIFALQWFQQPSYTWLQVTIGSIAFACLTISYIYSSWKSICIRCLAAALGISFAFLAVARTTHVPDAQSIDTFAQEQYVRITGTIVAEPDRRPMQTKYTIATEELWLHGTGSALPVQGKILATDRRLWPEFEYGDTVEVRGVLEKPGQIESFHYDRFLSRYDIYAVMYSGRFMHLKNARRDAPPHYAKATRGKPVRLYDVNNIIFKYLFSIKSTFESQINKLYAEPHASFMAGLLTGSRRGIPEHLLQDFNTTGLTHIIAISGYNITIVITVITGMLFWLPLKWRFVPAVAAIILFTIFVGASAAVVRAAIMGILGLLALQVGRQSTVRLSVLWTLFFMLLWNPKYLWYDAGFQLSFLAVAGLVELGPLLDRWFTRVPKILGMREALQMTIAAQLSAVPLIVMLFGRLSLIAPIANLVVAPFIPPAMLLGFVATMTSFASFETGQVFAYLGWGCLEWILQWTKLLAQIPLASVDTPSMNVLVICMYYMGVILWIFQYNRQSA